MGILEMMGVGNAKVWQEMCVKKGDDTCRPLQKVCDNLKNIA